MNHPQRIFIVGHPGAGKGLLAKTLAEQLAWDFIDVDMGLEYRVGKLLPEILGSAGEQHFQSCYHQVIDSLLNKKQIVVATDVSIFCSKNTRDLLATEFVIYLKTSTPVQIERTLRGQPPLLMTGSLELFLEQLHEGRDRYLENSSTMVVDGDDCNLEQHLAQIIPRVSNLQISAKSDIKLFRKDLVLFNKKFGTAIFLPKHQAICLKLLAQGKSSKEIASEIGISHRTVEGYIAKMMEELDCASSKELIALYHDQP